MVIPQHRKRRTIRMLPQISRTLQAMSAEKDMVGSVIDEGATAKVSPIFLKSSTVR